MLTASQWEALNAYVDGGLDSDQRAEIAGLIAADPAYAAAVAEISQLKAATRQALQPDASQVDACFLGFEQRIAESRRRNRGRQVAASIAGIMLLLGGWFMIAGQSAADRVAVWVDRATEQHLAWINAEPSSAQLLNVSETLVNRAGIWTPVPSLSPARLSLARVVVSPAGPKAGLFAGYVGSRGCRVGLWIGGVPDGLGETVKDFSNDDVSRYAWRVGDVGYAVIAVGMNPDRLNDIVAYLKDWSIRHGELRVADAGHSVREAPCLA